MNQNHQLFYYDLYMGEINKLRKSINEECGLVYYDIKPENEDVYDEIISS